MSSTGLPAYAVQVRPRSVLQASDWLWPSPTGSKLV